MSAKVRSRAIAGMDGMIVKIVYEANEDKEYIYTVCDCKIISLST